MTKVTVNKEALEEMHKRYKILQKRNAILTTFFACVSVAVDEISEEKGWSRIVYEIRRQVGIVNEKLPKLD